MFCFVSHILMINMTSLQTTTVKHYYFSLFDSARVRSAVYGLSSGKMNLTSCLTLRSFWLVSHIKSKMHNKRGKRLRAYLRGDMLILY